MTTSRDIRLNVTAEVKQYVSEMAKLPGVTEKQAAAAGRALAKELARAEREAAKDARDTARRIAREHDKAAKSIGGAGTMAARAKDQLEGLKFTAQGLGGRMGELAGRAENFGRAFASLGTVGGPIAVVALGLAAAATGAVAMAAGLAKVTQAAGRAAEALEPIRGSELFPAAEVARVEQANAALAGVGKSLSILLVQFGSSLAPVVETAASAFTSLALNAARWVDGLGTATLSVRRITAAVIEDMARPLQQFYLMAISGFEALAELTGVQVPNSVLRLKAQWQDVGQYFAGPLLGAVEGIGDAIGINIDEGRNFGSVMANSADETTEATNETTQALDDQRKVIDELAQSFQRLADSKQGTKKGAGFDKQLVLQAELIQAQKAALEGQSVAAETAADVFKDKYTPALSATAAIFGTISSAIRANSREAAIATKAAGLAQAIINTAVGVTASLPNIPLAIATGAAGAAQVAAIAAQPIPAFALGGTVPQSAPLAYNNTSDERLVTARPGERIRTREQEDALMQALNRQPNYTIELDGDTLGRLVDRDSRRNGPLSRKLNPTGLRQHGRA